MRRINVVIVCWGFIRSSILRQPWRHIYEISRGMTKLGANVTVISYGVRSEVGREEADGFHIRYYDSSMLSFVLTDQFIHAITNEEPDVIVWSGTPIGVTLLKRLWKIKKPIIWYVECGLSNMRDLSNFSFQEFLLSDHWCFFLGLVFKAMFPKVILKNIANSDSIQKIVVPNKFLKTSLTEIGILNKKIEVIPSTIGKEYSRSSSSIAIGNKFRKEFGFDPNDFIVTYLGSPCTLRGVDTLIKSVSALFTYTSRVRAIILLRRALEEQLFLSNLSEQEYLMRLVNKLKIKPYVQIISGILRKKELLQFMDISDAIVLPFKTLHAESPLAPLEAMRLGKVVIASDIGSLSELIGKDRGLLVKPNDANGLVQAILFLMNHPEEAKGIARKARSFAEKLPNWNEVAKTTLGVVKRVERNYDLLKK